MAGVRFAGHPIGSAIDGCLDPDTAVAIHLQTMVSLPLHPNVKSRDVIGVNVGWR